MEMDAFTHLMGACYAFMFGLSLNSTSRRDKLIGLAFGIAFIAYLVALFL